MKWLSARFHLINILNLDVAAGAAGMALLVNSILQQQVPWAYYYLLFSVVWTIYLLDHLYDSKKPEAISERRKFFKEYHRAFWWVLGTNLCISFIVFIVQFNVLLILYASPALGITGVYILANWLFQENRQRFYLKEILISLGYAFGIMVIPLSFKRTVDSQVIIITVLIILMALWNLLLIARFERNIDEKEGQTSMSQWAAPVTIRWINYLLYLAFIAVGMIYAVRFTPGPLDIFIYTCIALYMLFPLLFPRVFRKKERYHRYVDMVFLLSFLCLV
jgi:cobalamin synthase